MENQGPLARLTHVLFFFPSMYVVEEQLEFALANDVMM
jgi:hypothetical protein